MKSQNQKNATKVVIKHTKKGNILCSDISSICMPKKEKGITLISLIVMIVIIVILSAVVIRGIAGEGILDKSTEASSEYKIEEGKEQVDQLTQSIILKNTILGKDITLANLAEEAGEETTWVKKAEASIGDSKTNDDIVITNLDGYIYQVYYSEKYGQKFIEYIGREGKGDIPKVKASYDKIKANISVVATSEDEIEKVELIYKGEVVQNSEEKTATFNVEKTGWYKIKVTTNKGMLRYAWLKVTSTVVAPNIEITAGGEEENKENNWYGKANKEIEVTISTNNETATGIYYWTNTGKEIDKSEGIKIEEETGHKYIEGRSVKIGIKEPGSLSVYAYTVDKKGNESETGNKTIKYDNVKPEVGDIKIVTGQPNGNNNWYKTNIEISLENMKDENSGIAGYYYWEIINRDTVEVEEQDKTYVSGKDKTLTIASDGIKTIAFQAKDIAGNKSVPTTLTLQKDGTPPKDFTANIKDETTEGFTIVTGTTDETSKIAKYIFYVEGREVGNKDIGEEQQGQTVEYKVTGLNPKKSYTVNVKAIDGAGNEKELTTTIIANTKGIITTPTIEVNPSSPDGNSGYYRSNISITIKDGETDETRTGVEQIIYTLNGTTTTVNGRTANIDITTDGTYEITAQAQGPTGTSGTTEKISLKRDATPPGKPGKPTLNVGDDTGRSNTDNITNKTQVRVSGTAEAGTTVTITGGASTYTANVGTNGTWTQTINLTANRVNNITVTVADAAGNTSVASDTLAITCDTTPPGAPKNLDLNNDDDSGFSKTDNITNKQAVRVSGTAEANSQVSITGGASTATATANASGTWSVSINLTANRVNNIVATATDVAGNTSTASTALAITCDTAVPTTATVGTPTGVGKDGMTIPVQGADGLSGIYTYTIQISTNTGFTSIVKTETITTTNASTSKAVTGLNPGTTYYIRVIVTDKAGNTKTSGTVTQGTTKPGKAISELNVGDYVAYTPAGNSTSTEIDGKISGAFDYDDSDSSYWLNQTITYKEMETWRILYKSGNTITIVGNTIGNNVRLQSPIGYNNAVYVLNKTCNDLYKNTTLGLKARNINLEDIETATGNILSYDATVISLTGYQAIPSIVPSEIGCPGGSIKRSYQDSTNNYWSTKTYSYWAPTGSYSTCWKGSEGRLRITNDSTNVVQQMLYYHSGNRNERLETYWIASRGCYTSVNKGDCFYTDFYVFCSLYGKAHVGTQPSKALYTGYHADNYGSVVADWHNIRPVIDINLDNYDVGRSGTGVADLPFSLDKK